MLIPLIEKNPDANDFTCRDGEIEFILYSGEAPGLPSARSKAAPVGVNIKLNASGPFPTANIRIPLESGDKEKAHLLLDGEISRVDPATAERLTQAILRKTAETLLDLSTDLRRQGLFILPFRFFTMTMTPDGTLSYPSPQALALPTDYPPHPEITAFSTTDDALTLALRFPVKPHRLSIYPSALLPSGYSLRTFISYHIYIPDPKEIRGSIGSVRSATGGSATGIRFAFLSTAAVKASVAAPEKYYEMVGNERTGYRLSSKMAAVPDYSCYADVYGYVPAFSRESLLALGADADEDTDPMDWIADWKRSGEGYLPATLPYKYWNAHDNDPEEGAAWPEGIDKENILELAAILDMPYVLLTRPMALASDSKSRRNAKPHAIRSMLGLGLGEGESLAILYGCDDCRHWEALRRFDPRRKSLLQTPPRFWWRLLIFSREKFGATALSIAL